MTFNNDRSSAAGLIAWGVFLETLRRKDLYVLLTLSGLFALGVVIARIAGVNTPATATFMLNMGMTMAFLFASILTLTTAARQIPDEIENRTLYPLLAKPVTRAQVIVGKWIATTAVGLATMATLFLIGWLPIPRTEEFDRLLLLQTLLARALALALLAAMGIFLSLLMPKALNIVALGLLYLSGGTLVNFLRAKALHGPLAKPVEWATCYIPSFDLLDLTRRYTDGAAALSGPQFLGLMAYALLLVAVFVAAGCYAFERRPL